MPIFELKEEKLRKLSVSEINLEKDLQKMIETNLEEVFSIRLVASEFSTGSVHSGRIDSLGLSEDNNPVIIEYKKVQTSDLLNQSLFYLSWLNDHQGDFTVAAQRKLGNNLTIDWSTIRVICIAPGYRKYDLHAVKVMGANIELWQYKLYEGKFLQLEEVNPSQGSQSSSDAELTPAQKASLSKEAVYSVGMHTSGKSEEVLEMFNMLKDFMVSLDESVDEVPKKQYIAYRTTQNFCCVQLFSKHILLSLKLNYSEIKSPPKKSRDVSQIGHYGTGDFELRIESNDDAEKAKEFIELSYKKVGA